ncbi:CDK2-associated and cullin domain-containing protein 1-like [Watersipora subatra]|uniref:CDK2-associated and cullin domain-containing protein 1-like n=1 Tax=Watersipora subatra TaxID=2589382 RepID=UPI00355B0730
MTTSRYRLGGVSLKGYAELRVSDTQYENEFWPQLDRVIDIILNANTDEARCVSFEENYSIVYKIVCKGYGSVLYEDLMYKVEKYIDKMDESLQLLRGKNEKEYIEKFSESLIHFKKSMHSILSIFAYLNRCVTEEELDNVVSSRLNERLVRKHVADILDALQKAQSLPFAVEPATSCCIIKSLYSLEEDYGKMSPQLFQRFIPGYIGATEVTQLPQLSEEARELTHSFCSSSKSHSGSSHKRPLEEDRDTESWMDHT